MKRILFLMIMMGMAVVSADAKKKVKTAVFPDGSPIPAWFSDTA